MARWSHGEEGGNKGEKMTYIGTSGAIECLDGHRQSGESGQDTARMNRRVVRDVIKDAAEHVVIGELVKRTGVFVSAVSSYHPGAGHGCEKILTGPRSKDRY